MAEASTLAAQRVADAADYDAKMRAAMGLDLVNTIVAIRQEIDAMASRYLAAGKDPQALATAQINAALQGQDQTTLAQTSAALQTIDQAASDMARAALIQAIAAEVAAAEQTAATEASEAAARAQEQAAAAAERAADNASRAQEEAARQSAQAIQEIARAGQNIKDYIAKLKSGTTAAFSPQDRLAAAQSQYNADLALAQAGNTEALGRITSDADALLAAANAMYASGTQFQVIRDQIITQLNALPAVKTADQQMVEGLDRINSSIGTSNNSLSSISGSTASTSGGISAANALLASIDTNNDGFVSIAEIEAAAQAKITDAQSTLTAAAQATATNTNGVTTAIGGTTTAVGGATTAIGGTTSAIGLNTDKAGEVKGEITANNLMTSQIQTLNQTLTNAATSEAGGFIALGQLLANLTKYAAAAAFNTMYSRPADPNPGIPISSARGNMFGDGSLITSPTSVPLSNMGEGFRPEGVVPLERDSRGRLGARIVGATGGGGSNNDNRPVVEALSRGQQQSAIETQVIREELVALRREMASLRSSMQRKAHAV